jgi:hypothetical protein
MTSPPPPPSGTSPLRHTTTVQSQRQSSTLDSEVQEWSGPSFAQRERERAGGVAW